jgi:hypothetical protein
VRIDRGASEAMAHVDHLHRVAFYRDETLPMPKIWCKKFVRAPAANEQFDPATNMKASVTKILRNFFFDHYDQRTMSLTKRSITATVDY